MDSYSNIKAYRSAGLTLKGYREAVTNEGREWSCKVYKNNKKIGHVTNSGNSGLASTDIPQKIVAELVKELKDLGYKLRISSVTSAHIELTDCLSWFIHAMTQMIDEVARLRHLKRLSKTHMIIRVFSTDKEFSFYRAAPNEANRARLVRQLGADHLDFVNDEIACL